MIQFKRLLPEDYSKYEIKPPPEFIGQITWYGHPRTYYYSGPWLVLAFSYPKNCPSALTLHICYYDEEYLSIGGEATGFNIFHDSTGMFSFSEATLKEFIALLQHHRDQLREAGQQRPATFKPIDQETELSRWRFQSIKISGLKQVDSYYRQLHDPLAACNSFDSITIIRFSRGEDSELSFGLYHFPPGALADPAYRPEDESMGCINLDRQGIDEFIHLLQNNWRFLRV